MKNQVVCSAASHQRQAILLLMGAFVEAEERSSRDLEQFGVLVTVCDILRRLPELIERDRDLASIYSEMYWMGELSQSDGWPMIIGFQGKHPEYGQLGSAAARLYDFALTTAQNHYADIQDKRQSA